MDEATRKLERDAMSAGDLEAALRLTRSHLRARRGEDALAVLAAHDAPAALAARAEVLLSLDRVGEAADVAGDARFADPTSVHPSLRSEISRRLFAATEASLSNLGRLLQTRRMCMLADDDGLELGAVLSAPLLAAAQMARAPSLREVLGDAPRALVRAVAAGTASAPRFFDEAVPTRLFSAHGPDFDIGTFVAFEASCESRLTYFDASLFREVGELLELDGRRPAFGRGYGLAISHGEPTGDIDDRVAAVNAARVLPFPLGVHRHQNFDLLTGDRPDGLLDPTDARLARRFAEDVLRHPARLHQPDASAAYARILFAFRGGNPPAEVRQTLMNAARSAYGPVGARALEHFASRAQSENQAFAARRKGRF